MKKEINRSQRVKRLKKMILWTIALAILIPVIGCILLSVRVFQLKKQVAVLTEQLPTEEMQEATPRPRFSGLSIAKAKREINYTPHTLEEGIKEMFT